MGHQLHLLQSLKDINGQETLKHYQPLLKDWARTSPDIWYSSIVRDCISLLLFAVSLYCIRSTPRLLRSLAVTFAPLSILAMFYCLHKLLTNGRYSGRLTTYVMSLHNGL
ncbi:hypothetical protein EV361DRAFT_876883 [Lentinula raphanica]|nr:hypothetical protein EV361DRAFT_876883 [Lentinula raphanica]